MNGEPERKSNFRIGRKVLVEQYRRMQPFESLERNFVVTVTFSGYKMKILR